MPRPRTAPALASAAAAALAYTIASPPYTASWAAWLIPGLLMVPCRGLAPWRALLCGVTFSLMMGIGVTGWAFHASLVYFDFNRLAAAAFAVCVWLLYGGVPFGLMLAGYAHAAERVPPALRAPLAAWSWAVMEVLRTRLFTGMPWELLGHTQFRALWLVQIADLGGVYAVSFVMALASVAAIELIADAGRSVAAPPVATALQPARRLLPAATLLLAAWAYGLHARALYADGGSASAAVAVVQGNIPNAYRWQRAHMERSLGTYARLTESALARHPDLVVWPENAVDFYLEREPMLRTQLARVAARAPGGLLVGSPRLAGMTEARNSAQLLGVDGTVKAVYDKQHLVPFAEASLLPTRTADASEPTYGPGGRAEPLITNVGRLGAVICYEVLFPGLVNDLVRRGAQLLVNISNDSWLDGGDGAAPEQHFSMAVLTAIATRRDLVRVAGSGASGFIDASGRILASLPRDTAGSLVEHVRLRDRLTPYVRFGDQWMLLAGIAIAVGVTRSSATRQRA